MTTYIPRIRKAVAAAVTAGVLFYAKAVADGFTTDEIAQLVGAVVAAGVVTWAIPNKEA